MIAYIVSINEALYRENAARCKEFGVQPIQVHGSIDPVNKKRGIQIGMRRACLAASGRGGIVLQEDWGFVSQPDWDGKEFVSYAAKLPGDHLCPRAFAAPADIMKELAEVWKNPGRSACSRWRKVFRNRIVIRPITEQL